MLTNIGGNFIHHFWGANYTYTILNLEKKKKRVLAYVNEGIG